jgi:hypothetical protein
MKHTIKRHAPSPFRFHQGQAVRHYSDKEHDIFGTVQGYAPDGCVLVLLPNGETVPIMEGLLEPAGGKEKK